MSDQDSVLIEIQGKEYEAQVHYRYVPEESVTRDCEGWPEQFEFTQLYIPDYYTKYLNMDLEPLLDMQHVQDSIIEQLKVIKSKL